MRSRALLVALLAAAVAALGATASGAGPTPGRDGGTLTTALGRSDLVDVAPASAYSRVRDAAGREHDTRRDIAIALGLGLVLTLSVAWWLARERRSSSAPVGGAARLRRRAPPRVSFPVSC
jgi:hypothetical protein